MRPDDGFLDRHTPCCVDDNLRDEVAPVKSAVEAVSGGAQVVLTVLAVFQRVCCAGKHGVQIAEHALEHCTSVPKLPRNSGIDMPCWNWI